MSLGTITPSVQLVCVSVCVCQSSNFSAAYSESGHLESRLSTQSYQPNAFAGYWKLFATIKHRCGVKLYADDSTLRNLFTCAQ